MLDILRPTVSQIKPSAPPATAQAASPTLSPASSTSTLKASKHSRPGHVRTTSKSSIGTARSKGQQARRQSVETGVSSSHRQRYTQPDQRLDLLDSHAASSSSPRSSPGLAPFRRSTLVSSPHTAQRLRARSKFTPSSHLAASHSASGASSSIDPFRDEHSQSRKRTQTQKPLLGGLYFSDLIVVAFFYAVNLLRTCGIAELVDVAFKAFAYVCTRLPFDFYQRWSLSRPQSSSHSWYAPLAVSSSATDRSDSSQSTARPDNFVNRTRAAAASRSSYTSSTAVSAAVSSSDEETASQEDDEDDAQLSPFHHLTLLLVRFACTSFPHLVPRVLFAEETIGPLVRWRTGGGAAGIVREFTGEQASPKSLLGKSGLHRPPAGSDGSKTTAGTAPSPDMHLPKPNVSHLYTRPGFRAFWIGADAHVPVEVRRSDLSSKSASTLLYLHGGGFSLGSVAFYAEALIRIVTKVCSMEDRDNDARCVAVEYDLGPTSRFPGPLLQCLRCYAHLVEIEGINPASITVAGDSAGGNLTMAMLLCLDGQARGDPSLGERDWSALPMPGKAVLISPWADLRPSASLAFAPLREAAAAERSASRQPGAQTRAKGNTRSDDSKPSTDSSISPWTEAIGQHEWDYVAAEALMHFAQLYAGVLKTPRRVRGPMGWVAHMCAVLAGDEEESSAAKGKSATSTTASMGATAPLNVLRSLLPQRVARVAHSMLTEPLLSRAGTTSKAPFSSKTQPSSDVLNRIEHVRPSVVGALEPIFPPTERKTDAVPSTADLYIPIWQEERGDVTQGQAKRVGSDPDFEAAKTLLETSTLINPATGDWSRIRLKRGMLVIWGDRERLADDIEEWIDHVRQSQSSRNTQNIAKTASEDKPGQDLDHSSQRAASSDNAGQSLQERRAASRSPHRLAQELEDEGAQWLCTAVEHGPGGVHAWPFVSMYLAGAEEEREKGLEIIARFIAEPAPSPASTVPATPISPAVPLNVQLPARLDHSFASAAANSPPHLNAVSPAGSMPSDFSSRGDADEHDDHFYGSSYTDSEGWDPRERNELGLEGVYPHETVWAQPTPTPSTGVGTPLDSDVEQESIGRDELVHRVGLGLRGGDESRSDETAISAMEPVHLHRPSQTAAASSWNQLNTPEQRTPKTPTQTQRRSSSTSTAQTGPARTLGGAGSGRTLAELEAESDMSAPPSRPESPGWREDDSSYDSRDDDGDDLSAPSPHEIDRDAYFGGSVSYADDVIPMDPGFYGLAHYHTLRPEGLSDIAEEESQFDASSVLSSGNGGGALSPGRSDPTLSPQDGRSPSVMATRPTAAVPGRYGAAYAPSASEMARLREALDERERQYQERFAQESARRFPIEEEDDSFGDDGDVDWLDMEEEQQRRGPQQLVDPLISSSDRSTSSAFHGQGRGFQASAHPAATLTQRLEIPADDDGNRSDLLAAGRSNVQPPPSPARSASSASSRDKWW